MADEKKLDISKYIPKGKKEGYAVSPHTKTPVIYTTNIAGGDDQGEYNNWSQLGNVMNAILPNLLTQHFQSPIKIDPTGLTQEQLQRVMGHEEEHVLSSKDNILDKMLATYGQTAPVLKAAGISPDASEAISYAGEPRPPGVGLFSQPLADAVTSLVMSRMPQQDASSFNSIMQGKAFGDMQATGSN